MFTDNKNLRNYVIDEQRFNRAIDYIMHNMISGTLERDETFRQELKEYIIQKYETDECISAGDIYHFEKNYSHRN